MPGLSDRRGVLVALAVLALLVLLAEGECWSGPRGP